MGAKGVNKTCCCGGCSVVPVDPTISQRELQPLQQYCCACVPRQICVTYTCDTVSVTSSFPLRVNCDGANPVRYRGELPIDGVMVEMEFFFKVESGACYLCLESYALGITGTGQEDCKLIDDAARAELCPRCDDCPEDRPYPAIFTWTIAGTACAGAASIGVSPASNTSLVPRPRCCDCPDPCDGEPYLTPPYDESCDGPCDGCGCICSQACITVIRGNTIYTSETVDLCKWAYRTPTGFIVSVVGNESSNCCELELSELADDIYPSAQPANVRIGDINNPCPSPVGRWEFTDNNLAAPDNQVVVIFECATCRECPGVATATCCPGNETLTQRVLTATVVGGAGCCGTIALPLVYDSTDGAWIGEDPDGMCSHPIVLRLTCGDPNWTLVFSGAPCVERTVTSDPASTCDPLNLVFSVAANGLGCCTDPAGGTLTITITE